MDFFFLVSVCMRVTYTALFHRYLANAVEIDFLLLLLKHSSTHSTSQCILFFFAHLLLLSPSCGENWRDAGSLCSYKINKNTFRCPLGATY